ncbi:FtsX-like permease family protein [Phytohabitans aurantiacus]|uniref:ABC3 transporter permease C-terminal domain-containing protein n=1 Tax=Phytohabitans aurantiacus TaxID=3016789 RepID=A0ABQ5R7V0_9ACTN|nr:FtsX-like permease family protein [Phytohabitans aurantiacus]GLI02455.1 hypothetical protein Pa4123_77330 [Phytohabitans aurantiacus]
MFRLIWHQLGGHAGRSMALLAGVLLATTSFVVLTGSVTTSRLQATDAVGQSTRSSQHILVRPQGSRTPVEVARKLVRPDGLLDPSGGITTTQYRQIAGIAGVDVAAPVAMLGYAKTTVPLPLDLTDAIDRSLDRQVIRVDPTFVTDRELSTARGKPRYVYVTKHPLIHPVLGDRWSDNALTYSDGRTYASECGIAVREVLPSGGTEPVCSPTWSAAEYPSVSERDLWRIEAVRLLPDGRFQPADILRAGEAPRPPTERLMVSIEVTAPMALAAVDPEAEQRLVGLDEAVVAGRPLRATDTPIDEIPARLPIRSIPVVATGQPALDSVVNTTYTRLAPQRVTGLTAAELDRELGRIGGVAAGAGRLDVADGVRATADGGTGAGTLDTLVPAGPAEYRQLPDGGLEVHTVRRTPLDTVRGSGPKPWLADDVAFHPIGADAVAVPAGVSTVQWRAVGVYDPRRLAGELYQPPVATGADEVSREALEDRRLAPSGEPGGYLTAPPMLLTTLAAVPKLLLATDPRIAAPISSIRVRVSDVDGYDERSAERVRLVAERIAATTGLDVDVVLGSSPAPQTIHLPAGAFGRPALKLRENWTALGVAPVITKAVDRKSVALFLLVLVVCALFLGNAVSAAVHARAPDLAVLACVGWPARGLGVLIVGEVTAIGLASGPLALGLALPIAAAIDVDVGWQRAWLAVPIALLLAWAAGAAPALRAARAHPMAALRPPALHARWIHRRRTLAGLAMVNVANRPARTALGAGALAIAVAALIMLGAVGYAFRSAIVGSFLGEAVSLSVRTADMVAVAGTVMLGVAAVTDVLYLNVRERAGELATLQAMGWSDRTLARLLVYEGAVIGTLGGATGAGLGFAGAAWFVGEVPASLVATAAVGGAGAVLLSGLAGLVHARLQCRLPTHRSLAKE